MDTLRLLAQPELMDDGTAGKSNTKYIKKTQAEMKDILTEIKDNLQKINSRVDEANNQINDLEHKKKTFNQNNNKKTESKKLRIV